jgi:hypothetical protein
MKLIRVKCKDAENEAEIIQKTMAELYKSVNSADEFWRVSGTILKKNGFEKGEAGAGWWRWHLKTNSKSFIKCSFNRASTGVQFLGVINQNVVSSPWKIF